MAKKRKILELSQVDKGFRSKSGELKVLHNISLTVHDGEIIAIVGPSGCGKTTLLNLISGLLEPDQGEIMKSPDLRLAYIFQEPRLLPWKSVEANIGFVQDNFLPPAEAKEIRTNLLRKTGLLEYKDAYPAQLSGGMKQRLEIVRALSIKPQLLLMDEPFKSLDVALKFELQELILAAHSHKRFGVLLITHDPEEAVMLADRVLVLSDKPTRIYREIEIELPRDERKKAKAEVYEKAEEILNFLLVRS